MAQLAANAGLTTPEAEVRRRRDGPNAIADVGDHAFRRALEKFWSPVPWMLELVVALELGLGKFTEASVIAVLLLFNAGMAYAQEGRAQATLAALKSRLAVSASVRRDGVWKIVPAAELVSGDVVKLSLGGLAPADAKIIAGDVSIDQSMLTGESRPVEAGAGATAFAGSLIRRGEAEALVTATGARTKFGRTAELVRTAHSASSQQQAVFRVVRNLAGFNGVLILALVAYAHFLKMPVGEILPLVVTTVLASIPVALPATFTLAAALGARNLAKVGVLSTRLSAVDEAGTMDVLCVDKTGTLTENKLTVAEVRPIGGADDAYVLSAAACASAQGGQDTVDIAIRAAAAAKGGLGAFKLLSFSPFDPAKRMSEASASDASGAAVRIVKGAYATIKALAQPSPSSDAIAHDLETRGMRVIAVAAGPVGALKLVGLIALTDPPRQDSKALVDELHGLGVKVVMATGDAPVTALAVAGLVGIRGAVGPVGGVLEGAALDGHSVFAGVLPEDKFKLVKAFQSGGHTVGMCGDGANDAPALRQAQFGVAVSSATDVAKSAAGMVLTLPGLVGIVSAVREGRTIYQRVLTYTVNSITKKIAQVTFIAAGLFMTGHAILTPLLVGLMMIGGDFLGMSLTTDNVSPSAAPNRWGIGQLTIAGVVMGLGELAFCLGVFAVGDYVEGYGIDALRTLAFVAIVCGNQATTYDNRARGRMWATRPSFWLVVTSIADVALACGLALSGIAMSPLPAAAVVAVLAAAAVFAFMLDFVKVPLFRRLSIT